MSLGKFGIPTGSVEVSLCSSTGTAAAASAASGAAAAAAAAEDMGESDGDAGTEQCNVVEASWGKRFTRVFELNPRNCTSFVRIKHDKCTVAYAGRGTHSADYGVVQVWT